jgi:predicted amidohydrolase
MSPHSDDPSRRPVDAAVTADAVVRALEGGAPVVAAVAIGSRQGTPSSFPGRRMLIWSDDARGSLGDAAADAAVIETARALLEGMRNGRPSGSPATRRRSFSRRTARPTSW